MGLPLQLGCRVWGRHAADLQQGLILWAGSPAGPAVSPSHPTLERPCPLPGLWLGDPPSWHLGLTTSCPKPAPPSPDKPSGPSIC